LYGAEKWAHQKVDQKYLEGFETWCWRKMEKISSTDRMRNEEVSQRVKKTRNILHPITRKKANTIGHILRRNCLLRHVIQRKITGRREVTGRRRRRSMQPLDDLNDTRGYWKLKQKASDRTQLGSSSERGYGPGV